MKLFIVFQKNKFWKR